MWRILLTPLVIGLLHAGPAAAGKPAKEKGWGHGPAAHADLVPVSVDVDVDVSLRFGSSERTLVREYWVERHGKRHCPPGLAKKGNGCLPPGQAKKRYGIGRALDPSIVIVPLPADLDRRIGPPPRGYRYGVVDGDLVKLAVGSLLVVDAIDGLVD